jgi:hypothetical protein
MKGEDKTTINEEYLVNVKKTINTKEKSSIVDVRDVNWELINGVWKNDAGWEPTDKQEIKKIEKWIKKASTPIKESPLKTNDDQTWKEVVEEQKKSEEKFIKSQTNKKKTTELYNKSKHEEHHSKKGIIFYTILSSLTAICLGVVYLMLVPNIEETKKLIDSYSGETFFENEEKKNTSDVHASNKAYFMKYIIEESIWRAKIRASLYTRAEGNATLEALKDYVNINATSLEVISIVNKMFEKSGIKQSNLSVKDLEEDILILEEALNSEESKGRELLCQLANKSRVDLGTYPSRKVAEKALKEKWISPLGNLHEATTGESHRGKYTTDPNDPRSVGKPVSWK